MSSISPLRRSLLVTLGLRGVVAIGGILFTGVLGRYGGAEAVGAFNLALVIVLAANIISRQGSDSGLIRFVGREDNRTESSFLLRETLVRGATAATAGAVFLLVVRTRVSSWFGSSALYEMLGAMSVALVPYTFVTIMMSFAKATRRPFQATFLENGALLAACAIGVAVSGLWGQPYSAHGIGIIFLLSSILILLIAVTLNVDWLRQAFEAKDTEQSASLRQYRSARFVYMTTELLGYAQFIGGTLIAGALITTDQLGLLKGAERVAAVLGLPLLVTHAIGGPLIARACHEKNRGLLRKTVQELNTFSLLVSLGPLFVMLTFPERVLGLLGGQFSVAATSLLIFCTGQFVRVLCGPAIVVLDLSGHQSLSRNITLVSSVVGLLLYPVLVPILGGLTGAATAASTSMIVHSVVGLMFVFRHIGLLPFGPFVFEPRTRRQQ